jgi:hypothetical protein
MMQCLGWYASWNAASFPSLVGSLDPGHCYPTVERDPPCFGSTSRIFRKIVKSNIHSQNDLEVSMSPSETATVGDSTDLNQCSLGLSARVRRSSVLSRKSGEPVSRTLHFLEAS